MKLKIASALILSAISINALAYEGHGFTIVSQQESHTPGFGIIEGGGSKKNSTKAYFASAMTMTYDAEGHRMEFVKIQSDHDVNISNYTHQVQRYTYTYVLSCESAYETFGKTVDVQPGGSFTDSSHVYGTVQKEVEGSWAINASTQITGGENAFHESHAMLRVRS